MNSLLAILTIVVIGGLEYYLRLKATPQHTHSGAYTEAIELAVLAAGGRDFRVDGSYPGRQQGQRQFLVTFAAPSGRYYQTTCYCLTDWKGSIKLEWAHDLTHILADHYKALIRDIRDEEIRQALHAEGERLRDGNRGKERLIDLLHSSYRNERLWGIKLAAELAVTDGIIVERLRDLAYMDAVKEVRQAAADRLAQIERH